MQRIFSVDEELPIGAMVDGHYHPSTREVSRHYTLTTTVTPEGPLEYIRMKLHLPRPVCLGELMKRDGKSIDEIVQARAPVRYPRHRNLNQLNPVHRGVREQFKEYLATKGITAKNSRQAWATAPAEEQHPMFVLEYSFQYFMHRLRAM